MQDSFNTFHCKLLFHKNTGFYTQFTVIQNIKEYSIPEGARILRVCDVFAALISNRPYRSAFDVDTAMELMIEEVKNFDMKIFLAFQRMVNADDFIHVVYTSFLEKDEEIANSIRRYLDTTDEI